MSNDNNDIDAKFRLRIQKAIETVQGWDKDPALLRKCRNQIPLKKLLSDAYQSENDVHHQGDALLLLRLARYFKSNTTWVNAPPCDTCGSKETSLQEVRSPNAVELQEDGNVSRVEVYTCPSCPNATTTFPRWNSPRKLLETKRGRCGEYANLFGLYCRSLGFETRYILDVTDHVWTEVLLNGTYIMVDSCEGVIGEPSMYEAGWGKELSCMVAVSLDQVVDVTPRYTRQFVSKEFQQRRRLICSSEHNMEVILQQFNATLQRGLSKGRVQELSRRLVAEHKELEQTKTETEWIKGCKQGRQSGSLAWRASRKELGNNETDHDAPMEPVVSGFRVESFTPNPNTNQVVIDIATTTKPSFSLARHASIVVSGATCSVDQPNCISLVVLDQVYLGCVLQSKSFDSWIEAGAFVATLPKGRIVAMSGKGVLHDKAVQDNLARLGGFSWQEIKKKSFAYIGMVEYLPKWAKCVGANDNGGATTIRLLLDSCPKTKNEIKLRTERQVMPRCVSGRLPEHVMPLATQLLANEEQKRKAFLSFDSNKHYSGYTTKRNAPIYLLDETAYPFERNRHDNEEDNHGNWNTFHWLPEPLVSPEDHGIVQDVNGGNNTLDTPKFDIPLDSAFFTSLLGPNLLVQTGDGGAATLMDTTTALSNSRLVALYFSAHWCGPCRRFTPMLAEMYTHLKQEVAPTHGLEIVFCSSDRDLGGFEQYHATMPWLAVPYQQGRVLQQEISTRFGVRGIPALVVLDAISGQVVVPIGTSRADVTRACQGGDLGIENMLKNQWFPNIPRESQEIMEMLELSCAQDEENVQENKEDPTEENPYLVRSVTPTTATTADPAVRIKEIFAKLVAEGDDPNTAAAKAIKLVAQEQKQPTAMSLEEGPIEGESMILTETDKGHDTVGKAAENVVKWNEDGRDALQVVLSTAQKYLANAIREPWTSKFRAFKLGNKVMDRITRIQGGLGLLCSLGFAVHATRLDFVASIPLAADLEQIDSEMNRVREAYSSD